MKQLVDNVKVHQFLTSLVGDYTLENAVNGKGLAKVAALTNMEAILRKHIRENTYDTGKYCVSLEFRVLYAVIYGLTAPKKRQFLYSRIGISRTSCWRWRSQALNFNGGETKPRLYVSRI